MKAIIYSFFLIFLMISCNEKKQEQINSPINANDTLETEDALKTESKSKFQDTLHINYSEHTDLLTILTVLPDSTMQSWSWKEKERKEFVNFIARNNFTIDTTEHFSTIKLIKPNILRIQVVDGSWTLSIYKIKPNNFIAITNDIVGDGNDIQSFEYNNGQLNSVKLENLFGNYFTELVIDKNSSKCLKLLEDNKIGFEYDFESATEVEISNSFYLKEKENKDCLSGNTLNYLFNPKTKKFDLAKINWTQSKE